MGITEESPRHNPIGQAADNKIQDSGADAVPAVGGDQFEDRPAHKRNTPDSWAYDPEKKGLFEHGM